MADRQLDFGEWRRSHGLSLKRAAELLMTPIATIRNWGDNRRKHPGCLPLAIAYLEAHPHLLKPTRKVRTPKPTGPLPVLPDSLKWRPLVAGEAEKPQ
jgi:hypothetical protein